MTLPASIRRLGLFLPRDNDFYRTLFAEISRGFARCGVEVKGATTLLGPDALATWCAEHRPQLVFEMNRPRCDAVGLPPDVLHACWVVDLHARPITEFQGSDLTYLFSGGWVQFYPNAGFHRWLGPGACDAHYPWRGEPAVDSFTTTFAFAGHIPNPWTRAELDRDLTGGLGACTFGDVLPELEELLRDVRRRELPEVPPTDMLADIDRMCRRRSGHAMVADEVLEYDFLARVVRHINRTDLVDAVLGLSRDVAVYGPENWSRWPAYAPYYRGWLATPGELARSIDGARVNLHEGVGIHFRSMSIMSAGGLLAYRNYHSERLPGGLEHEFEPHVHYVPFDIDTIAADLEPYLADPMRAQAIRTAAAREIAARHTWTHRAAEILRDAAAL